MIKPPRAKAPGGFFVSGITLRTYMTTPNDIEFVTYVLSEEGTRKLEEILDNPPDPPQALIDLLKDKPEPSPEDDQGL